MLALCMIVKNEECNLKSCLTKAAAFVDEIIIVDTGSTDSTKKIATEFTDKIYDFKWCKDFSKARNYSVSKAAMEWILVLDADEFITDWSEEEVDAFINNSMNDHKVGRIKIISTTDEASAGEKRSTERVSRIFNRKYFQYEGIIHEQLVSLKKVSYETVSLGITVDHIGYTREALNRKDKLKRNIDLLEEAINYDTEDPYLYYQAGKAYYTRNDYKTSVSYFEKALVLPLDYRLEYVEDLVETYGYALINNGNYPEALLLENCSEVYTNSSDFHFLMGLIYMNNGRYAQAIENFLKCTGYLESKVEGITSYRAYYNIGVIYEVLGFINRAIEYYTRCEDYEAAKERLKVLQSN